MSTIISITPADSAKTPLDSLTRVERLAYGTALVQAFEPGSQLPRTDAFGKKAIEKVIELAGKLGIDVKDLKDKEKQSSVASVLAEAMFIKAQNQRTKLVERTLDYGISKGLF